MHWHLLCYHFISNIPSKSADANVSACVQNTIPSALGTRRNELKASTFSHIPSALSLPMPTPAWQMAYPLQLCPYLRKSTQVEVRKIRALCYVRVWAWGSHLWCDQMCVLVHLHVSCLKCTVGEPICSRVRSRSTEGAWQRSSCFHRTRMPPATQLCLLQWCCCL